MATIVRYCFAALTVALTAVMVRGISSVHGSQEFSSGFGDLGSRLQPTLLSPRPSVCERPQTQGSEEDGSDDDDAKAIRDAKNQIKDLKDKLESVEARPINDLMDSLERARDKAIWDEKYQRKDLMDKFGRTLLSPRPSVCERPQTPESKKDDSYDEDAKAIRDAKNQMKDLKDKLENVKARPVNDLTDRLERARDEAILDEEYQRKYLIDKLGRTDGKDDNKLKKILMLGTMGPKRLRKG